MFYFIVKNFCLIDSLNSHLSERPLFTFILRKIFSMDMEIPVDIAYYVDISAKEKRCYGIV